MVMAPENAVRHPVGNQVDFTTVSAMEHFFGQVSPFVIMHGVVHANNALHLVRKSHQVVRYNHNRHRFAEFRKHAIKSFNPSDINVIGRFIQKENLRIADKRTGNQHALAFTATQFTQTAVQEACDMHAFECCVHFIRLGRKSRLAGRNALAHRNREIDILVRVLRNIADSHFLRRDLFAKNAYRSRRRLQ